MDCKEWTKTLENKLKEKMRWGYEVARTDYKIRGRNDSKNKALKRAPKRVAEESAGTHLRK